MWKRLVGIALTGSLLLGGCYTKTQQCTAFPGGPVCSEPTNTVSWPSGGSEQADDHTGAIAAAGALVTAIALFAVLYHRDRSEPEQVKSAPPPAPVPVVTYVLPPSANGEEDLRLQRMFVQGHISARAGRCEAVTVIGKKLAVESPSFHARYAADPTISQCLLPHVADRI